MSIVNTRISLAYHPYVTCMYSYVIRMSLVCTRISFICHSYVLVCHLYVTRMYSYVIRMSLVCTRMPFLCHSYVLVCHPYVTRMWFYHEPIFYTIWNFISAWNEKNNYADLRFISLRVTSRVLCARFKPKWVWCYLHIITTPFLAYSWEFPFLKSTFIRYLYI